VGQITARPGYPGRTRS